MHKVSFQELLDCFGIDLENNAWNLGHNPDKLQEILNRTMQRIMSIVTSALERTVIHRLIAAATITFSKQKGVVLSKGGYYMRAAIKLL